MSCLDELDVYVPLAVIEMVTSLEAEIERLRAELKMLYDAASDLIEVTRMPNIEHVADAHNAAVRLLRTGHYGTAMNALKK